MKNSTSVVYAFVLIIGDFIALLGAFIIAYILRVTLDPRPLLNQLSASEYLQIWFMLIPVWIVIFALLGLYKKNIYQYRLKEASTLLIGCILGIMAVITYDFASDDPIFPARLIPVYGLVIGFLFLVLMRTILRASRMLLWRYGFGVRRVLIIGNGPIMPTMISSLNNPSKTGYKVVAVSSKDPKPKFKGSFFSNMQDALLAITKLNVNIILFIGSSSESKQTDQALAAAVQNHVGFKFIPTHGGILSNKIEVDLFQGLPVVSVHQTKLTGWGRLSKRLFDIIASLFGIIILSPIYLIITLLVWISDGGKPIFKQKRLSRFNNPIYIYKFRTMKKQYSGLSPEEAFSKMGKPSLAIKYRENGDYLANDPRVTTIGSFLRKTSLDELPQLLNVLRGDISLVGPRALVPQELKNYPYKNLLLSVKSGLTGLAQISGRRDIGFDERRSLDLYYVQNWSFWLDIKIIFRTAIDVFRGRGAK